MGRTPSAFGVFLSTLPARGATDCSSPDGKRGLFLSTLPARGATALRFGAARLFPFLSTLPARGATRLLLLDLGQVVISIHAPREGSDPVTSMTGRAGK